MISLQGDLDFSWDAALAIMCITIEGSVEQIAFLVRSDVFTPLCNLLDHPDEEVIKVALDTLVNILELAQRKGKLGEIRVMIEKCDGAMGQIEQLQHDKNYGINKRANYIIDAIFRTINIQTQLSSSMVNFSFE